MLTKSVEKLRKTEEESVSEGCKKAGVRVEHMGIEVSHRGNQERVMCAKTPPNGPPNAPYGTEILRPSGRWKSVIVMETASVIIVANPGMVIALAQKWGEGPGNLLMEVHETVSRAMA